MSALRVQVKIGLRGRFPAGRSGHDSDRPLAGSNQPDCQRANEPVTSLGRRPYDDSLCAGLVGDPAELGERVAAPGHEGDGYAPLLRSLFHLAAQVAGDLADGLFLRDSHRGADTGHSGGHRKHRRYVDGDETGLLPAGQSGCVRTGPQRRGEPSTPTRITFGPSVPSSKEPASPNVTQAV
jgi:hypothetical protein